MFLSQKRNLFDIYGTNGFFYDYKKSSNNMILLNEMKSIWNHTNSKPWKCKFAANEYIRMVLYQRYQLDEIEPTMQIKQF